MEGIETLWLSVRTAHQAEGEVNPWICVTTRRPSGVVTSIRLAPKANGKHTGDADLQARPAGMLTARRVDPPSGGPTPSPPR